MVRLSKQFFGYEQTPIFDGRGQNFPLQPGPSVVRFFFIAADERSSILWS